jgi:predicted nuclease with RNAse H fold
MGSAITPSRQRTVYAGVDVGGRRKGFHLAVVDERSVVLLQRCATPDDVVAALPPVRAVAIDAPRALGVRPEERRLAREICRIRWTPAETGGDPYYEWIEHGLELYELLPDAIEVFPTASLTRWVGPRLGSRAAWSTTALAGWLPPRSNQDERDAIAAALTAREHDEGRTESYGAIVVPR